MYYYIKRSGQKVIHRRGCYHLNNTEPSKTGYFGSIAEAEANGYRVCKHCAALKPLFKAENGDIEKICKEHAISVYNNWAFLDVDTVYGQWKIVYDERCKKLKLFHKNSYDTGNKGAIPGYHPQHCSSKTICGYLDYIIMHDDFRHYNPLTIRQGKPKKPQKGTKAFNKRKKKEKLSQKRRAVRNVLRLIEGLSACS